MAKGKLKKGDIVKFKEDDDTCVGIVIGFAILSGIIIAFHTKQFDNGWKICDDMDIPEKIKKACEKLGLEFGWFVEASDCKKIS